MRRIRAADRDKMLWSGVDLPIDAGTCGRWVWPGYKRCHACAARRRWFLKTALNPVESTVSALLESLDNHECADTGKYARPEDSGRTVPLLDDLPARDDPCLRW